MNYSALTWPYPRAASNSPTDACHIWLRLLETTDVHAHLMPYDYHRGTQVEGFGLARTATLVARARNEAGNCLLFDNGDFLQGSELSDLATGPDADWTGPHPVIAAMNHLGYAAACLGNHEFNFGLDWLERALDQVQFPVLCANALRTEGHGASDRRATLLPPSILLPCTLTDNHGRNHVITIGVLGLLPPQITTWDHAHLHGRVTTRGIVETAQDEVPRLRAAGADIVIALAHTGLGSSVCKPQDADPAEENAALSLASIDGIDAILAGHSHQVFPDANASPGRPEVDQTSGTLAGVPAVMAGYRGSHLGVLDLCLSSQGEGWSVAASQSDARPVLAPGEGDAVPPLPAIVEIARPAHLATLRLTSRAVGHSAAPLHSYLAQLRPCPTLVPVLAAKTAALRAALARTQHASLPVLAASAPFKTGGHAGPDNYVDIPAGPLTLGNMAELYPFPNKLIGLRLTGADIEDWLERAASCFHQILAGQGDTPQPLWNPAFPGHAFDTISGLDYVIDLSQPARFDAKGALLDPGARRIRRVYFNGAPLPPDTEFALATNNFRAFGSAPYRKASPTSLIHDGETLVRDHLVHHIRDHGPIGTRSPAHGWKLTGPEDAVVLLETGPGLYAHPEAMAKLDARDLGLGTHGFARFEVRLKTIADLANPANND